MFSPSFYWLIYAVCNEQKNILKTSIILFDKARNACYSVLNKGNHIKE
nr:MAG TPA: hypothetical protein [Caudoviricetes sp.]